MTDLDLSLHLRESLALQAKAMDHLRYSLDGCAALKVSEALTSRELVPFEALASRFVRASDMLFSMVFRALDSLEFYENGSPLDVLNRADKRGLIEDFETILQIRRLRNRIAHEYTVPDFSKLSNDIRALSDSLFEIYHRTQAYAEKFLPSPGGTGGN